MPSAPRRHRNSSSESSDDPSSSSDEEISIPTTTIRATELTLKDDENTMDIQAPLPEEYGKNDFSIIGKMKCDFLGESDDDRRAVTRVMASSASGIIDDDKKQQIAKKKRKRFYSKNILF